MTLFATMPADEVGGNRIVVKAIWLGIVEEDMSKGDLRPELGTPFCPSCRWQSAVSFLEFFDDVFLISERIIVRNFEVEFPVLTLSEPRANLVSNHLSIAFVDPIWMAQMRRQVAYGVNFSKASNPLQTLRISWPLDFFCK